MRHPHDDDPNEPLVELELHVVPPEMTAEDYIARCVLVGDMLRPIDKVLRGEYITVGEA